MDNQNQFDKEKEMPAPPPFRANVRTMQSDIKSVQEGGGQAPQPYLAEIDHQEVKKEEPIFQPNTPATPLPPNAEKKTQTTEPQKPKNKKTKIIFIILGILVLLIILGWLGYYFISQLLSSQNQNKISTPEIPTPISVPTSTPENISNEKIILSPLTLENFKNTLKATTANIPLNNFKKITFLNENQSLINLSDLLPLILPELKLNKEEITRFFSENFSLAAWVDKNGSWPVFIVQIKPTAALIGAQTFIKEKIEALTQRTSLHFGWVKDKLIISSSLSGYSAILQTYGNP